MSALERKGRAVFGDQFLGNASGPETGDIIGFAFDDGQARAGTMSRIMHWRQALPIGWPSFHVLKMGAAQELYAPELARVPQFSDVEKFSRVDHRLHHHVIFSGFFRRFR